MHYSLGEQKLKTNQHPSAFKSINAIISAKERTICEKKFNKSIPDIFFQSLPLKIGSTSNINTLNK